MNPRLSSFLGSMLVAGSLAAPASAQNFISDGSFEQVQLTSAPFYQYASVPGSPWTFSSGAIGGSGISGNTSAFGSAVAPHGSQVAFLQAVGSTIFQDFTVPADDMYVVTFMLAGRYFNSLVGTPFGGVLTFDVSVDSNVAGTYTTTDSMPYTSKFAQVPLTSGSHRLTFHATGTTAAVPDQTAFIDKVSVTAVPEPNSMLAIGAALGGLGVARQWLRRRRS
jgi:hypothetical protein